MVTIRRTGEENCKALSLRVRVAVANGGDVESCSVVGTDVLVMVGVRVGTGPFGGSASAKARAGPVEEVGVVPG